jgi:hypothetical protein
MINQEIIQKFQKHYITLDSIQVIYHKKSQQHVNE